MKNDNLLDDIENIVDNFLNNNKKRINNDIKKIKNNFSSFMDKLLHMRIHPYQEEIEIHENLYSKRVIFKCSKCMSNLEIFYTPQEINFNDVYDNIRINMKVSNFYCPICGKQIKLVGDLVKIVYKK
jgi:Zn finger protein HypA/HybF involved in hydrogenase expression